MTDGDGFKTAGSAAPAKTASPFKMVKMIYGHGRDAQEAKDKFNFIPSGGMNDIIRDWHAKQPPRDIEGATPSSLTKCPRTIWLEKHNVPRTVDMTWAVKQRMLLGRIFENQFAVQLDDAGMLLQHWKDDPGEVVERFADGEGLDMHSGVPDYLLQLQFNGEPLVVVSDAKTARSDSFGYVATNDAEVWTNWGYYKYRIQLTDYYRLCHSPAGKAWFAANNKPLPEACHLFVYALDDGVVRRELTWKPSAQDLLRCESYTNRFNAALLSEECPACTCKESFDEFDMKFCPYGVREPGKNVNDSCCSDSLIPQKG